MPALPAVNKVVRVDLNFSFYNDVNSKDRLFFSYTGAGPSVADMTTFLLTVGAAWNTDIAPLCVAYVILTTVQGTDLTSNTGAQALVSSVHAGSRAGTAMAAGVAAVVRMKIARRYRGGHPRMYLPAGQAGDITAGGIWTAGFQSSLASNFAAFIAACVSAPPASFGVMTHVNVSYFSGFTNKTFPSGRTHPVPSLRVTPLVDTITAYTANPKVGGQRRRNLGK